MELNEVLNGITNSRESIKNLENGIKETLNAFLEENLPLKINDILPVFGYSHAYKDFIVTGMKLIEAGYNDKLLSFDVKGIVLKKDGTASSNTVEINDYFGYVSSSQKSLLTHYDNIKTIMERGEKGYRISPDSEIIDALKRLYEVINYDAVVKLGFNLLPEEQFLRLKEEYAKLLLKYSEYTIGAK